jgi:PhnB protein
MTTVNSYLAFDGRCEEAFKFYEKAIGKPVTCIMHYKDMPGDTPCPPETANLVLHANMPISTETCLMGCDTTEGYISGNNVSVTINVDTAEEATSIFTALSEGGLVYMPLERSFFAEQFGMLVDRFGINWIIVFQGDTPS